MLNDDINIFLGTFAYPFVSLDFLHDDIIQNYYTEEIKVNKKEIREKFIKYMTKKYNVYTYDEIYLYIEKWYLYPRYDESGLKRDLDAFDIIFEHLEKFTTSFISQRDGKIVYKYWGNKDDKIFLGGFAGSNKIYLMHSLNRLIPLDILIVIYMLKNNKDICELNGNYGNIEISDALLDRVLEKGVAENHLHGGVATSFLTVWDRLMNPIDSNYIQEFRKAAKDNIRSKKELYLICLANYLRLFLTLKISTDGVNYEESVDYLIRTFRGGLEKQLEYFCAENEQGISMWQHFSDMYSELTGACNTEDMKVRDILEGAHVNTSSENLFLYKLLKYIKTKENDIVTKMLFLNYLRIKNYFYQSVVQQKTIHGLNFFQEMFYRSNSGLANKIFKYDWDRTLREQFQNENIVKLELRRSLENSETRLRKYVDSFLKAYLDIIHDEYCSCSMLNGEKVYKIEKSFPKVNLVFHLLKKEEEREVPKRKNIEISEIKYSGLYYEYKKQLEIFNTLRNKHDIYSRYMAGIDVASLENVVPTWVYADVFENARDSRNESMKRNKSLGFTFHAGEDFRHLLSGLRRIYEIASYLKFHAGDRIGHGIALGVNVDKWYMHNETILIPRIEALENYIWVYDLLSNNIDKALFGNLDFIENKIYELAMEIFDDEFCYDETCDDEEKKLKYYYDIHDLINSYKAMFDGNVFETCRNTNKKKNRIIDAYCSYNKEYLMYEPIHMKVEEQEIAIMKVVQEIVKNTVDEKGIIVEVNPSSNVVISDMDTLDENQVYSINNYGYDFKNIMVCINSDDPSVFNTNAANELGYIYFGMLERNVDREYVLSWIEKLRKTGMDASFIRGKDSDELILRELEGFVKDV